MKQRAVAEGHCTVAVAMQCPGAGLWEPAATCNWALSCSTLNRAGPPLLGSICTGLLSVLLISVRTYVHINPGILLIHNI